MNIEGENAEKQSVKNQYLAAVVGNFSQKVKFARIMGPNILFL